MGCGTVTLYAPEIKKVTLQQQLKTEVTSILALSPDLLQVHLADGAKDNWRLMNDIEAKLPAQAPIEIVDFYHACEHLKNGCGTAWGESTQKGMVFFERLRVASSVHSHFLNHTQRRVPCQIQSSI